MHSTRNFKNQWEHDYFLVEENKYCLCLICNKKMKVFKKYNLKRHYELQHASYDSEFPLESEVRKEEIIKLKKTRSELSTTNIPQNPELTKIAIAALKVSKMLAESNKNFTDGIFVKNACLEIIDTIFKDDESKKELCGVIQSIPLTRNSVTRRVELIDSHYRDTLMSNIKECTAFSIQIDESTDITDIAQLIIFTRSVMEDLSYNEEFLGLIPLTETTRGVDIYEKFKTFVKNIELPLNKLVSITTDGAPAMTGSINGFISLCRRDKEFPKFLSYHCIIHQQVLCCKVLNIEEIMSITTKIVNSIRAKSLQRRLFREQIADSEDYTGPSELLLYTNIRWLSKGYFLKRFWDLLDEIKSFLKKKDQEYPQLDNNLWVLNLAFFVDLTCILNKLNLQLQGKDKFILDMITVIITFKEKLNVYKQKLEENCFDNFPTAKSFIEKNIDINYDIKTYIGAIEDVSLQFERGFSDFSKIVDAAQFMYYPFKPDLEIKPIADRICSLISSNYELVEDEIITLKNDLTLKARSSKNDFWKYMERDKYPLLMRCLEVLLACFGSTYLCESAFSKMKMIKSEHRTRLTSAHLMACLRISLANYPPDYEIIAAEMECRKSLKNPTLEFE